MNIDPLDFKGKLLMETKQQTDAYSKLNREGRRIDVKLRKIEIYIQVLNPLLQYEGLEPIVLEGG